MAFFGLTALGPQSVFASNYKHAFTLDLFDFSEFERATARVAKGASSLSAEQIWDVLTIVYHGPVPDYESARVRDKLGDSPTVQVTAFLEAIKSLQATAVLDRKEPDQKTAAHFVSLKELTEQRMKGIRSPVGPAETFALPVTLAQDVGWKALEADATMTRYPKKHCAETKFAAALQSSGYL